MLCVQVADKGRGIGAEDIDKLFTMFGKLEDTDNLNQEGVGLGLTICQKIVENNGGAIEVHSDGLNKGSTFTFTMKMLLPEEEKKVHLIREEKRPEVLKSVTKSANTMSISEILEHSMASDTSKSASPYFREGIKNSLESEFDNQGNLSRADGDFEII